MDLHYRQLLTLADAQERFQKLKTQLAAVEGRGVDSRKCLEVMQEIKTAEDEQKTLFVLVKKSSVKVAEASFEFKDLDETERKELDSHFQKALKFFKGDHLKAIAAAAVKLQLYKIGDYFSAAETRQLLNERAPVAVKRKAKAATFRPHWVPLARCAKIVGISRNTVSAWHGQGFQLVQGITGRMEKVVLKRHPVTNQVNLPLVQHIARMRRMVPSPGKPLNQGKGELAAAQLAAPSGSPQQKEAAATLRALAAIERVHSPALLEEIRTRIKRRLRARKKQSSKPQRGRLLSLKALKVKTLNRWAGDE